MSNEHKTVIGILTCVSHGPDGVELYYFEVAEGEYLNIKFVGGHADAIQVPLNTKIALCMSTIEVDGFRIVCNHQPYFTEVK